MKEKFLHLKIHNLVLADAAQLVGVLSPTPKGGGFDSYVVGSVWGSR